jgi:hypothetical protein
MEGGHDPLYPHRWYRWMLQQHPVVYNPEVDMVDVFWYKGSAYRKVKRVRETQLRVSLMYFFGFTSGLRGKVWKFGTSALWSGPL